MRVKDGGHSRCLPCDLSKEMGSPMLLAACHFMVDSWCVSGLVLVVILGMVLGVLALQ